MISGNNIGLLFSQDQGQLGEMFSHPTGCCVEAPLQMSPTTWTKDKGERAEVSPQLPQKSLHHCICKKSRY